MDGPRTRQPIRLLNDGWRNQVS